MFVRSLVRVGGCSGGDLPNPIARSIDRPTLQIITAPTEVSCSLCLCLDSIGARVCLSVCYLGMLAGRGGGVCRLFAGDVLFVWFGWVCAWAGGRARAWVLLLVCV